MPDSSGKADQSFDGAECVPTDERVGGPIDPEAVASGLTTRTETEARLRVVVIGTGHVGLVTAVTLTRFGHTVVGLDDNQEVIQTLASGRCHFFEDGLQELLDEGLGSGRLRFLFDPAEAIARADMVFICVGTPGRPTGDPNLVAVERAATTIGRYAGAGMLVVEKSTVPVQTAERIDAILRRCSRHRFDVVSNPEFLREGRAVEDSLNPERILVGAPNPWAHELMRRLYAPLVRRGVPFHETDVATAELAKNACNAFLALKISFANALARICEAAGADVVRIAEIMGSDKRIGRAHLEAGLGYGGSCFPKDLAAFRAQTARLGYDFRLLDEVGRINDEAIEAVFSKISQVLWNLEGKRIMLLGLAYKAGTDDVRESPALRLARLLIAAGADVVGHDPLANANSRRELPNLMTAEDPYVAAEGADCVVIGTDWPQFRELDLDRLKGTLLQPIVVDGRNLFDPATMAKSGLIYIPTGRPPVNL
jgi:UDPglucose 6-dehydrogenase